MRALSSGIISIKALAIASPVQAQAWVGTYAANVSAQHKGAKAERECQAGVPPKPAKAKRAARDAQTLMGAMLQLTPGSDQKDLAAVFDLSGAAPGWKDLSGRALFDELGERLAQPGGARFEPLGCATGNDAMTARGVWRQTNGAGAPPRVFAVAFAWLPVTMFGNGWRITRGHVLDPVQPRPELGAYCHLSAIWP